MPGENTLSLSLFLSRPFTIVFFLLFQPLLFPNQNHGHFSVSADGTLRITNVEYRDAGTYTCQALSTMASKKSPAVLTVIGMYNIHNVSISGAMLFILSYVM